MTTDITEEKLNKIATHPLQSWAWGEFRRAWGNEVIRTPFGQIIFSKIPHTKFTIGTFIKGPKPTKEMLNELKTLGKEKNAIFIKLEPNILKTDLPSTNYHLLKESCVPGKTLFTPETFWIDLTRSEEELLKSFSSKTRYNIRLAQKHGVIVEEDNSDRTFEKYLKLTFDTAKRQNFYAHTPKYHRLMWKFLNQDLIAEGRQPIAHLLTAVYKSRRNPPALPEQSDGGQVLTAWILFVWKDFLYYPYGASSDKHREVMANNLIMWEAIKFGKKLGLKTFDLWGREEGKGFTRFKEGYNPKVVEFIGTWDLVINKPIYWIYRVAESIRWFVLKNIKKIL